MDPKDLARARAVVKSRPGRHVDRVRALTTELYARSLAIVLIALVGLAAAVSPAAAKRVALVIGNGAYQHTPILENPKNDAADMIAALNGLGFQIVEGLDLDKPAMDRTILRFAEALAGAEVGAFFYAGHGLQVGGVNYLVPVDAKLSTSHALDFEMVRLDVVQRVMENATQTNVIFLDACRDNPLSRNLARALGQRSGSIGRGLAQVEAGLGTLISYATQPGNVALDGKGRNSPYTTALKAHIAQTGEDLSTILIRVRNDVIGSTQGKQIPWDQSALRARLFLTAPQAASPSAPSGGAQPSRAEIVDVCSRLQAMTSTATLEALLPTYAGTPIADCASARLRELRSTAMAPQGESPSPPAPQSAGPSLRQQALKQPLAPAKACTGVLVDVLGTGRRCLDPVDAKNREFEDCVTAGGKQFCAPRMVVLPKGTYKRGSPDGEVGRARDEGPASEVTIGYRFAVGKFEVTFEEWDACIASGGCKQNPVTAWGRGRQPVRSVSWYDVTKDYLPWLNRKLNLKGKSVYRLPTEAEWEYAARAGTTTPFATGETISTSQANYDGDFTYGVGQKGIHRKTTTEVGSFSANKFGIYDMHGNVMEWVEDCYGDSYAKTPIDGSKAPDTNECSRVVRGGHWGKLPEDLRSARRGWSPPGDRFNYIGFRLARTLPP